MLSPSDNSNERRSMGQLPPAADISASAATLSRTSAFERRRGCLKRPPRAHCGRELPICFRRTIRGSGHGQRFCRESWVAAEQPRGQHESLLGRRWRPPGDGPGTCPRLRVVDAPRKPPAQLNRSRSLPLLTEDSADRSSIALGDDEHPKNMVTHTRAGERGATWQPLP